MPTKPPSNTVERLLEGVRFGNPPAVDELFDLVYDELRRLAHGQRCGWIGSESLNTTALVHEAYVRLAQSLDRPWKSRGHFLSVAARAMRFILIDYARQQRAAKRGGGARKIPFDEQRIGTDSSPRDPAEQAEMLLMLDDALQRLEERSERQSRIVECRFFGGMTIRETAEALDISPASVKRGWTMAQAWLHREMKADLPCW